MFSLICDWTNIYANNQDAGDLRRHRAHYDITVMHISSVIKISSCLKSKFLFWLGMHTHTNVCLFYIILGAYMEINQVVVNQNLRSCLQCSGLAFKTSHPKEIVPLLPQPPLPISTITDFPLLFVPLTTLSLPIQTSLYLPHSISVPSKISLPLSLNTLTFPSHYLTIPPISCPLCPVSRFYTLFVPLSNHIHSLISLPHSPSLLFLPHYYKSTISEALTISSICRFLICHSLNTLLALFSTP